MEPLSSALICQQQEAQAPMEAPGHWEPGEQMGRAMEGEAVPVRRSPRPIMGSVMTEEQTEHLRTPEPGGPVQSSLNIRRTQNALLL